MYCCAILADGRELGRWDLVWVVMAFMEAMANEGGLDDAGPIRHLLLPQRSPFWGMHAAAAKWAGLDAARSQ